MSVRLTTRPLSTARALAELTAPGLGGIVVFVGRVRPDRTRGGTVRALEYESHRAMTLRSFRAGEAEARRRHGAERVVLWHRIGTVRAGEPSVIVGAASAHRRAAFDSVSMLIERVKSDAPLWKVERARPARPRRRPPSPRAARSAG